MLNLTRDERRVILFLIGVALLGMGINFFHKRHSRIVLLPCIGENLGKVSLNKADKKLLLGVTGIGEKLAGRIIEYRQIYGGFKSIEELKNIRGIDSYRYDKIKDSFILD
ncbi:MAG: helix-hairpin-helix domain-containing protein [Candidatus Omnitrophica bacterium]|nr:helix-hairpin-helix domain-containing protein [Candidatus Omnitrophota bacterium]